jgi:signal transduction histidine kinase
VRIALRIFVLYLILSLVLGGALLFAAYESIQHLVVGIANETAIEMSRELGILFSAVGTHALDKMTPEEAARLQEQVGNFVLQSERVETLLLIDNNFEIRVASDPRAVGKVFKDDDERAVLKSDKATVRDVPFGRGHLTQITVPIKTLVGGRIGTLRVQLIPDYYVGYLDAPQEGALWFFTLMIVFIGASGVALASVMTIPVRRLNRTLLDLQTEGGVANVEFDAKSDFAPALGVVRGLGERLQALAESSKSSAMILATITEALEQGIVICDAAGKVVSVNDSALRMLGIESTGEEAADARLVAAVVSSDPYLSHLAVPGAEEGRPSIDMPRGVGAGHHVGIRAVAHPLRQDGRVAGTMLLLRDLGSTKALERHLQEASRLTLLTRLTSTVAHEIKNPLNSMVINVEALRSVLGSVPLDSRKETERMLEVIASEVYHLDEVIREYLGLAAEGTREAAPTDVRDVVEKVIAMVRYEANQSRVAVASAVEPDLPPVRAVSVRLKQALLNLVLNAIQAMPAGGAVTVRAALERGTGEGGAGEGAEDRVRIEVADTGPGIPEEIRSRIFDLEFSTKESGSGLGLPITRLIVESGGGKIDFETRTGQGTTFRLVFPADQAP